MFITMQLTLFLANNMECDDAMVLKFLHLGIFIISKYFSLFMSHNFFYFQKKLLLFNVFSFAVFRFIITGNIKKQRKTKLRKNQEDIVFYA